MLQPNLKKKKKKKDCYNKRLDLNNSVWKPTNSRLVSSPLLFEFQILINQKDRRNLLPFQYFLDRSTDCQEEC